MSIPSPRCRVMTVAAVLLPTLAFAGEKQLGNLVWSGPAPYSRDACNVGHTPAPPSGAFVAGVSKGKFKFDDKCKGKLKLAKLTGLPADDGLPGSGDEIICLITFHSGSAGCGTFILRGAVAGNAASGKTKIGFQGAVDLPTPGLCPPPPTGAHVTTVECYEPDPGYAAPAACAAATGTYHPFAGDPSQGLCAPASTYVPNPASPVLAVQGVFF